MLSNDVPTSISLNYEAGAVTGTPTVLTLYLNGDNEGNTKQELSS